MPAVVAGAYSSTAPDGSWTSAGRPIESRPDATVWSPVPLDQTFSVEVPSLYAASSVPEDVRSTPGCIVFPTVTVDTGFHAAAAAAVAAKPSVIRIAIRTRILARRIVGTAVDDRTPQPVDIVAG